MRKPNFTVAELCRSQVAEKLRIANVAPPSLAFSANLTIAGCERVRAFLGKPMLIDSGYRCEELNRAVGGAKDSQHMRFEAVDFRCPEYGDPKKIAKALQDNIFLLGLDQVILEPTWVHVSFTLNPRCETLTLIRGRYAPGIITA